MDKNQEYSCKLSFEEKEAIVNSWVGIIPPNDEIDTKTDIEWREEKALERYNR
ncbi:MAG: hypothetical protein LBM93_06730 [Oscillospiraceae bacterium]|nr:hypothetical protein [Oscillospiraceae bacterium]